MLPGLSDNSSGARGQHSDLDGSPEQPREAQRCIQGHSLSTVWVDLWGRAATPGGQQAMGRLHELSMQPR